MASDGDRGKRRALAPFALSVVLLILYCRPPSALVTCEKRLQDFILRLAPPVLSDSNTCVILAGDAQAGSLARLIRAVGRGKPRAVGIFECPQDGNAEYAAAAREAGGVVLGFRFATGGSGAPLGYVEKARIGFITNPWGGLRFPERPIRAGVECADKDALDAASGCGFLDLLPDGDGIVRGVPLVAWSGDTPYQALAVALLAVACGARRTTLEMKGTAIQGIDLGGLRVQTDAAGRLLFLDYAALPQALPASDVLSLPPGWCAGKIVLIGPAGVTVQTRDGRSVPEVVVQATAIENALHGDYLRRSRAIGFLEVALIMLIPLAVTRFGGWRRVWAAFGALALAFSGEIVLLLVFRHEMLALYPATAALLSLGLP